MIRFLFLIAFLEASLHAACVVVDGDRILARHLSEVDRAFSALNPDLVFSYSPTVGKKRVISGSEIVRWAAANGIGLLQKESVCFERTGHALKIEEIITAIKRSLVMEQSVQIDVVDFCKEVLPPGKLDFKVEDASLPLIGHPDVPVLWRGDFVATGGTHYPVWARVRVLVLRKAIRAKQDVRAQSVIEADQLEETQSLQSPLRPGSTEDISSYVGKIAKQTVPRGSILEARLVQPRPAVERGSVVRVDVFSGTAHLQFEAFANSSGCIGDAIVLTNPAGSKRFRGVVTSSGRVEIRVPDEFQLEKHSMISNITPVRGL
jgi:flagella basal body P-ring formation protein FlgA